MRQGFIAMSVQVAFAPTTRYGYWPQREQEGAMSLRITTKPPTSLRRRPRSDRLPPVDRQSVGHPLLSPKDFTGVHHRAGYMARIKPEFDKRNTKSSA